MVRLRPVERNLVCTTASLLLTLMSTIPIVSPASLVCTTASFWLSLTSSIPILSPALLVCMVVFQLRVTAQALALAVPRSIGACFASVGIWCRENSGQCPQM
ncbi:hypothetical protein PF001_g18775 [Phytophthora fragariae]|uniref:Uncharacterized protein n=2 Tax=Phytophthora fragariae TaxID=53985 RepID=A0A6A4CJA9_9STRA|nr:hypothetical protein PF001_g18775 [Phytophthora fragariae]